jgi:hypothetical protein
MATQTHDILEFMGGVSYSNQAKINKVNHNGSTYKLHTLGSSNHSDYEREMNDYYATDPIAVKYLLEIEKFNHNILEPCCGEGHISKVLINAGYDVKSTDLIYRGFGDGGVDFFTYKNWQGDIITNPPYKLAQESVEHSLKIIPEGNKVAMFLKLLFLEGKERKKMFMKYPPIRVHVSSSRLRCCKNGDFSVEGSAICYAWFIWEKGYKGDTIIKWFN